MHQVRGVLEKLKRRGHAVNSVIDVGASNGVWSEQAYPVFPNARYLLIEANAHHQSDLQWYMTQRPNMQFVIAGATDREGSAYFLDTGDPFGGTVRAAPLAANAQTIPSVTIDGEVARRGLTGPFLIKLDTHGMEVPILNGANQTLQHASIVILETYIFSIGPESLLFDEMCRHMDGLGFRCVEMFDAMWRDHDQALWQIDMAFVRKDAPEFGHSGF